MKTYYEKAFGVLGAGFAVGSIIEDGKSGATSAVLLVGAAVVMGCLLICHAIRSR
jgi:hypothetical protein